MAGSVIAGVILASAAAADPPKAPAAPKPAAIAIKGDKAPVNSGDWSLCRKAANAVESRVSTPEHLLSAITLTESGRSGPGRKLQAWPWTINVGGKGFVFSSKDKAVKAVRRLMAQGHRSIDVGCMQVNLKYHPRAFTSLEEAFDPTANLAYGADFLARLKKRHGSWDLAVQHYHSYTEEHRERYAARFNTVWALERKRMAKIGSDRKAARSAMLTMGKRVTLAGLPGVPGALIRAAFPDAEPSQQAAALPILDVTLTGFGMADERYALLQELATGSRVFAGAGTRSASLAAPVSIN
jgi:hypothetical protein